MHEPYIDALNAALAELGRAWRIVPVTGIEDTFALSTTGPVPAEAIAGLADSFGLDDLSELDDYLDPLPGATVGGVVFCAGDTTAEIDAGSAWWAAGKLGLSGLLPRSIRDAHGDHIFWSYAEQE